jgi:hypothetical protein
MDHEQSTTTAHRHAATPSIHKVPAQINDQIRLRGIGLTFDAPALTTYNNKLYAFVRGTDNGLHFASFNGTTWDGSYSIPGGGLTYNAPAVATYNNKLHVVTRGSTGNGIHYNSFNGSWAGWKHAPEAGLTFNAT